MSDHPFTDRPVPGPRPMLWDEPSPEGVLNPFEGSAEAAGDPGEEALRLLGMPTTSTTPERRLALMDAPSADVIGVLDAVGEALTRAIEDDRGWRRRIDRLSADEQAVLLDALGEGEVWMALSGAAPGEGEVQLTETALAGVWVGRAKNDRDTVEATWIEVADAPKALREAATARPRPDIAVEALTAPRDAMNVMSILGEIRARAAAWRPGAPNHVMNFTLFPMTEADTAFLAKTVGEAGVRISSGGYGAARVVMTALRNVWAVQYLNGLGAVILDTIEIGDVPDAVLAARTDFEDSRARLAEIRDAYL
ncbi:MAG: hydrogenase expression/formation C-terminal domain-containing protein [Pseudomonadota bacterium]